jgi:hypothetical protein
VPGTVCISIICHRNYFLNVPLAILKTGRKRYENNFFSSGEPFLSSPVPCLTDAGQAGIAGLILQFTEFLFRKNYLYISFAEK